MAFDFLVCCLGCWTWLWLFLVVVLAEWRDGGTCPWLLYLSLVIPKRGMDPAVAVVVVVVVSADDPTKANC